MLTNEFVTWILVVTVKMKQNCIRVQIQLMVSQVYTEQSISVDSYLEINFPSKTLNVLAFKGKENYC